MKRLLKIFMFVILVSCCGSVLAQDISIMPGGNDMGDVVRSIATGGKVWENYREEAKKQHTLGEQFRSGIMTWDTILDYCVYLAKFLGQVALLVGAMAIIFLGYQKITKTLFTDKPKGLVMVIVGILVIIFAYVIVKAIRSAFIS